MKTAVLKNLVICWMTLSAVMAACDTDNRLPEMMAAKRIFQVDNTTAKTTTAESLRVTATGSVIPSDNPIRDALRLLKLDESDLTRPRAYEEGYIMLARLPLIDRLSESPFILQLWADEMSGKLQQTASKSITDAVAVVFGALNGGVTNRSEVGPRLHLKANTLEAYRYLCRKFGQSAPEAVAEKLKKLGFTPEFDQQFGSLVYTFADAAELAIEAYSDVSPKELEFLTSRPERFFYPHGDRFDFLTAPTHIQGQLVSIARKIKFNKLFDAVTRLTTAIDAFVKFIGERGHGFSPEAIFFANAQIRFGTVMTLPSPIGDIVILGQDDNEFHGSAAFILDLGGNDRYSGAVGAGHLQPGRISVLVDVAGNDTYGEATAQLSQGAGVASIGLVADLAGDDHYIAGDMAQGCGLYGIGALLDFSGNDVYEMGVMGQGFGVFGVGLLIDRHGNDRYAINGMGQGLGSTMGFGALVDNAGDDDYRAQLFPERGVLRPDDWSHAQGVGISVRSPDWQRNFSLYGGIGFLSDGAGDDAYYCLGGNCMGSAYFMSAGALVDHTGNDQYFPKNGNGLGFAVHLASGILIDKDGDDQYFAKNDSGGVGADRSVGMLVDYAGNDLYGPALADPDVPGDKNQLAVDDVNPTFIERAEAGLSQSSYASASRSKGLGLLIDYNGDDRYFAQRGIRGASCGAVIPPPDPHDWSHAFLIDLGGQDFYFPSDRKNNSYRIDLGHGLFYDVDRHGCKHVIGGDSQRTVENRTLSSSLQEASMPAPLREDFFQLVGHDNFERFGSVGRLMSTNPEIISVLIDALMSSQNVQLTLSLIEVLNHFILNKEMNQSRTRSFERLLNAHDSDVRIYAARTLGWWNITSSTPALTRALNDADPEVRPHVIWAIGRLGRLEDLTILDQAALFAPSLRCKQETSRAFYEILARNKIDTANISQESLLSLLTWIRDPDPIVRKDAALGMRYIGSQTEAFRALTNGLKDTDIYVKRASAKSLALLGHKEAIPVLIDSLRFPSSDTTEYYDQDLVKEIAFFCGTDFTEEKRYDVQTWADWWEKNGNAVDLKKNLVIMETIETAFAQEDENEGLRILEKLLIEHPQNNVIKLRSKRFCQDWITYRLLAQESIDRNTLERCLRLQNKIVELEPSDPQARKVLAGFYARLSMLDEAVAAMTIAVQLAPDNRDYKKLLIHYQALRTSRLPVN